MNFLWQKKVGIYEFMFCFVSFESVILIQVTQGFQRFLSNEDKESGNLISKKTFFST